MSIEAMKQALDALERVTHVFLDTRTRDKNYEAIQALRKAIEQAQEPKCCPHPKAPHGFNRNGSHANDRYTCDCETWDAYEAGYQAGVIAGIEASMSEE